MATVKKIKKAQDGTIADKLAAKTAERRTPGNTQGPLRQGQVDRVARIAKSNPERAQKVYGRMRQRAGAPLKNGGKMAKAKDGKSFPDLNKDGKITKADILKGRGVIAKKGAKVSGMKKCKYGCK